MKTPTRITVIGALIACLSSAAGENITPPPSPPGKGPWSPAALAASADGQALYVACATAGQVAIFDLNTRQVLRAIVVPDSPQGLALAPDGRTLYVACTAPESTVCVVDTTQGRVVARISAGHTAMAPVLSPDGRTLYVCHRFNHEVAFIDLASRRTTRRVNVPREPVAAAVTPDGKLLLVANHLHAGRADSDVVAASVSAIDTARGEVVAEITLPNGSGQLRDVRVSPDGRHAVVTHQLSRFQIPETQVDRGWVNTSALSLIDISTQRIINTVLLDSPDAGAANPWAAAWSADGRTVCVTHAGTHELSMVDFPALLTRLARLDRPSPAGAPADYVGVSRTAADVPNDLSFLHGLRRRIKSSAADRGPRAVALAGTKAYVANYFSDSLTVIELTAPNPVAVSLPLHAPPTLTVARRGEALFNDATLCFQGWQSCASCHSADARVDGLNWDLLNDGIGNPKNARSLVLAHQTPPSMSLGVRANAAVAVRAGIRFSLFTAHPEADAAAIDRYLETLQPMPSPHLVQGQLSPAARRGQQLFLGKTTGCADCHPPGFFTDLRSYDVGTHGKYDRLTDQFDTPTLVELWRSGPYLHDGSATSLREVFTSRNRTDQHGRTSHLNPQQIDDLVEYVLSL